MTTRIFAVFDASGLPVAFYDEAAYGTSPDGFDRPPLVPAQARVITPEQRNDFVQNAGSRIWSNGSVARYTPPPAPAPLSPEISPRQFYQQLAVMNLITRDQALIAVGNGNLPPVLLELISQLSDSDQFSARMLLAGARTFVRTHPLVEMIRIKLGWTLEQLDTFWRSASAL